MFVTKSVCAACLPLNEKVKIVFIGYWLSGFDPVVSNIYLRAGFFTSSQPHGVISGRNLVSGEAPIRGFEPAAANVSLRSASVGVCGLLVVPFPQLLSERSEWSELPGIYLLQYQSVCCT